MTIFLKLHDATKNTVIRVNVNNIVAYVKHKLDTTDEILTAVFLTEEPNVVFVKETVEDIDNILKSSHSSHIKILSQ